jgi:hypothetical protein
MTSKIRVYMDARVILPSLGLTHSRHLYDTYQLDVVGYILERFGAMREKP